MSAAMRILCFADTHIGAGQGFGTADYGPGSRLADQEAALERIVDLAIDEQVGLCLFAGDLWHRPRPAPWEIATAQRPLRRLADVCPVIAITGNTHDMVHPDLPTAPEVIFGGRFRVSTTPKVILLPRIPGSQDPGPAIATLPWAPVGRLVASRNGGDRDGIHHEAARLLIDLARGLRDQCPDDRAAILVAHWSVTGARTPNGTPTDVFREPLLPLGDLEAMGWDAVILGHIHRPQQLARLEDEADNPIIYCGSPYVVDWGEADTDHGVWIIETDGPQVTAWRFHPIPGRTFRTLSVDFLDGDDFSMLLEGYGCFDPSSDENIVRDAIVRVRYRATEEQARHIDHAAIVRALEQAGAHRVYAIQPEIIREDRRRVEGLDETLSPLQALDMWVESHSPSVPADALRDRTAAYLERAVA